MFSLLKCKLARDKPFILAAKRNGNITLTPEDGKVTSCELFCLFEVEETKTKVAVSS
jgi:hypothetical protein